jgi:hypothetical protein
VLGELPPAAVTRVELPRLSPQAVEALARRAERSAAGVHAATGGNPFFVTEVLRDAGSCRAAHGAGRGARPRRAAAGGGAGTAAARRWCRATSSAGWSTNCWRRRWPTSKPAWAAACWWPRERTSPFRHELGRVAIESSLSPPAAQALHARVLAALVAARSRRRTGAAGAPRAACGRHGGHQPLHAPRPPSRRRARRAPRSAAQWRIALREGAPADDAERRRWLEAYAVECQLTDQLIEAIEARRQLGELAQDGRRHRREAHNLSPARWCMCWRCATRRPMPTAAAPSTCSSRCRRARAGARLLGAGATAHAEPRLRRERRVEPQARRAGACFNAAKRRQRRSAHWARRCCSSTTTPVRLASERRCEMALADGSALGGGEQLFQPRLRLGRTVPPGEAEHWLREGMALFAEHEIDFYFTTQRPGWRWCELYAAAGTRPAARRRGGGAHRRPT